MRPAAVRLAEAGRRHPVLTLATLAVLATALAAIDALLGRGVAPSDVLPALLDPGSVQARILVMVRGPRVTTAVVAGAALGVAGVLLQSTLRNPLASPELTGVNTSAVLGVVAVIALGLVPADASVGMLAAALVAGVAGGMLVWSVAGRRDAERQLLVGVLLSVAAGGVITLFLALRSSRFAGILRWLVGSVDGRVWADLLWAGPWVACFVVAAALSGGVLPVLWGGDEHAASLGLNPIRARWALLLIAVCLVAGSASLAGAVTFVGLAVPHLVRGVYGAPGRWSVPAGALIGSALLCGCDALAQLITGLLAGTGMTQRVGVPAGAVAAVAGATVLVFVVRSQERK